MNMNMRVLVTDKLTLEPQVAAHAEELFLILGDPAIYDFENEPPPSLEWLRARLLRLESRTSPAGDEQWLNWVIRLPTSVLIGYVQATLHSGGPATIAYVLSSKSWGHGLAREAVQAMLSELTAHYGVGRFCAVLKRENFRSLRLLERLGFSLASPAQHASREVEAGELLMQRDLLDFA